MHAPTLLYAVSWTWGKNVSALMRAVLSSAVFFAVRIHLRLLLSINRGLASRVDNVRSLRHICVCHTFVEPAN